MTSSTSVTRRPDTSGPSASLQVPYSLACLRTNRAGRPVRALSTVAIGTPPSSRPPSSSVPSGTRSTIWATTLASSAGSASKRYLSKYSEATWPDRSVNSPVSRQQVSTSRARVGSEPVAAMQRRLPVLRNGLDEVAERDAPAVGVEDLRAGRQRDQTLPTALRGLHPTRLRVLRQRADHPAGREGDHQVVGVGVEAVGVGGVRGLHDHGVPRT